MRNVTVISHDKVKKIAAQLGLEIKEKSGEYKIFGKEAGIKRSIAVPNTKNGATRIYLVGFEMKQGFIAHPKPPANTVTQMLDHSAPEKVCLSALFKAAKSLVAKPVEKPAEEPASPPAITEGNEAPAVEAAAS